MRLAILILTILAAALPSHVLAAKSATENVCAFVAMKASDEKFRFYDGSGEIDWPNFWGADGARGRFFRDYLVRFGRMDLDGDGVIEDVTEYSGPRGTSGGDSYEFTLSSRPAIDEVGWFKQLSPEEQGIEEDVDRWNYGTGWLSYDGRWYEVGFTDEAAAFPTTVAWYQKGFGKRYACQFESVAKEIGFGGAELFQADQNPKGFEHQMSLCKGVQKENALNAIEPDSALKHDAAKKLFKLIFTVANDAQDIGFGGRRFSCTHGERNLCADIWTVDADNDGKPDRFVKVKVENNAGRGYQNEFFIVIDEENRPLGGSLQTHLLLAQGVDDLQSDWPARPGEQLYDWVSIGGKNFLERRGGRTVEDSRFDRFHPLVNMTHQLYHTLTEFKGGDHRTVCSAAFQIQSKIVYQNAVAK